MIIFKTIGRMKHGVMVAVGALALAACATTDDTSKSQLPQSATGQKETLIEADNIAIAGQYAAHAIRELPQVTNAPKPPMVQFMGVTSVIDGPVDTEPYNSLLRDRLLVGSHEQLRYIERELPPLILTAPKKIKSRKELPPPVEVSSDPDYRVQAELRGNFNDNLYKIQIQFVDAHTGEVLFDGLYHIRKEMQMPTEPNGQTTITNQTIHDPGAQPQSSSTGL